VSDENKQENEEQEHDVEAHKKWHGHPKDDAPSASDEDSDGDEVEAHLKHHRNS